MKKTKETLIAILKMLPFLLVALVFICASLSMLAICVALVPGPFVWWHALVGPMFMVVFIVLLAALAQFDEVVELFQDGADHFKKGGEDE